MSTELATELKEGQVLAVPQEFNDDVFATISSSGKWLPRLMLFGSNSDAAKEGKIPMAHYGLASGKDNIQDLGEKVDILPIIWRPKAMDLSGDDIITVFDHTDPEFQRIMNQAEVADSKNMFGPEFLVWIPSVKKFAGLYMASKTSRREAPAVQQRLGKPSTLRAELIKTKKYSWHGIQCIQCSTPFDVPPQAELDEQVEKFKNPPKSEIETAEEVSEGRKR